MRTFGQLLPATLFPHRTPEGLLHVETCRKGNSGSSAEAVIGQMYGIGLQSDIKLSFVDINV
jgi:hypothetical protein